jgi:hypothetical protein
MNQKEPENFDVSLINEKIINIDNTYDLISEIFTDNIFNEKEQRNKYFIFSTFLLNHIQFPFNEIWRLFKIILSINPNITREKTENNKYFGFCIKLCVKLLHKSINNLNLDKNLGFKCKEVPAIFDLLFSFPLIKHFINLIEMEEHKKEINEILNEVIKLIYEKIKNGKNNAVKNIFNNFYHFLDIDEKTLVIPKSDKSFSIQNELNKSDMELVNNINLNLNKSLSENKKKNSMFNSNNSSFTQLKDNKTKPHSKNNSPKTEKKSTEAKNKNKTNNDDSQKKSNNKIINDTNIICKYISLENRKNVNREVKTFRKYVKEIINKVNDFINFEEMKKAISTKLDGNNLMQIGSFLYMNPFPDLSNINIDLLISRKNDCKYYIKKYFDTFEALKNIPNVKCSFFCLNKEQYFFDCLEKNKSFFHLTRTDLDDNQAKTYPFKTVTVHLYAYNMIYGYSSFFIKKVYSTLKNVSKLHSFFENILLREFPILKSNYEISVLIINFLQTNYKIFSEKCEDKKFTYFAYDKSKYHGFLTNFPLLMQYKTLYFFEFDEEKINTIKQKPLLELCVEFHKFICKYLEYVSFDGNQFDFKRNDLNIFRENCFLDTKYIFNRIFLDKNLIMYKNNAYDEFRKIQNLFNVLTFE